MMRDCQALRDLLPSSVTGDLTGEEMGRLQAHLNLCEGCRQERARYSAMVGVARDSYEAEYRLPDSVRARIARGAAERVARRPWSLPAFGLGSLSLPSRPGLLATLTAAAIALVVLPLALRIGSKPAHETAVQIQVVNEGGAVRLAWSDGTKSSYTVYKTSDPRGVARAEVHRVKGNVWTDEDPGSSPIVFYRIE
jgi:anti-sigma factor RsiW